MADKYMCMRCKSAGAKSLVPFKIIEDKDGMSVKFMGQLCERCFKELFEQQEKTDGTTN
jgi:DNA-directed RNA polymerase subunit RPC12/RpoP